MELITDFPVLGDLYEEYTPSEGELKQLEAQDKGFHSLLTVFFFYLHIHLAYESGEKIVYHKYWLSRRPHPVLWELFKGQDFQPAMDAFFFAYPMVWLELASYLTLWLCRVVFVGCGSDYIRSECFVSACRLAFGEKLAMCPVMVARLSFGLKEHVSDIEGQFKPSV